MSTDIGEGLENGLQNAEDSETIIIIRPAGESGKFIQFAVNQETAMLDFPVLSSNENTTDEVEFIREHISGKAEEITEGPAGGEGIKATLSKDGELVTFIEKMISEIWPDCTSIETELV